MVPYLPRLQWVATEGNLQFSKGTWFTKGVGAENDRGECTAAYQIDQSHGGGLDSHQALGTICGGSAPIDEGKWILFD